MADNINLVTDIKVNFTKKPGSSIIAFADVSMFNGLITVKGFKVATGQSGPFVAWPSQYSEKDSKWYGTVFCNDENIKAQIDSLVMQRVQAEYPQQQQQMANQQMQQPQQGFPQQQAPQQQMQQGFPQQQQAPQPQPFPQPQPQQPPMATPPQAPIQGGASPGWPFSQ